MMSPQVHVAMIDARDADIERQIRQRRQVERRRAAAVPAAAAPGRVRRGLVRLHLAPARPASPAR
jgi:hypothetical protein